MRGKSPPSELIFAHIYFKIPIGTQNERYQSPLTAHSIHSLGPTEGRSGSEIRLGVAKTSLDNYL